MRQTRPLFRVAVIALVTAFAVSANGWQRAQPQPTELQRGLVWADLWMQTSGEYVACCLQTYRLAADQVERNLKELQAKEVGLPPEQRGNPPAVIMDLDETVADNATYQTHLYDAGIDYEGKDFTTFVIDQQASIRTIPGAKEFIARMDALGVTVVFITDRKEETRQATIATLARNGINTHGMEDAEGVRLIIGHDEHDKVSRRAKVLAKYQVIGLVGDQLGDFSDEFTPKDPNLSPAKAAEFRRDGVYAARGHFGIDWFVLPQPVYGSWQRALKGEPSQFLRRAQN